MKAGIFILNNDNNIDKIKQVSESDLLQYAIQNGIINLEDTRNKLNEMNRQEALQKHNYSIWQGKNGKYYTKLPDSTTSSGVRQIMRNSMERLEDAIAEFYMEAEYNPTVKETYKAWVNLKFSRGEICKGTVDRYDKDFEKYFKSNNFYKCKIKNISETDLENFMITTIVENNLTHKAFSNCRTLIYGIFKFAKKEGTTNISISTFVKDLEVSDKLFKKKIVKKEEEVFDEDEIPMIQYYLETHPTIINLGILLTFYIGVRAGELSTIKISDVDLKKRTIFIQRTEIKYKNNKGLTIRDVREFPKTDAGVRYIILTDKAIEIIQRIMAIQHHTEWLLEKDGKRIRGQMYSLHLYRICDRLHIGRRSIHKIRKTYITNLLDAEVDESLIMEQVGHANIDTTQRYYYFSNRKNESKLEQLSKADKRMQHNSEEDNTVTPIRPNKKLS